LLKVVAVLAIVLPSTIGMHE